MIVARPIIPISNTTCLVHENGAAWLYRWVPMRPPLRGFELQLLIRYEFRRLRQTTR